MEVWCKDRAFSTAMVRPRVIQEGVRVNLRRKLDEGIGRVYGPQGRTASVQTIQFGHHPDQPCPSCTMCGRDLG